MKKNLFTFLGFLTLIMISLSSCDDEKDTPFAGDAFVEVTVVNSAGASQYNEIVYLFKDVSQEELINANLASRHANTNSAGVVKFYLDFNGLNIINDKTILSFVVYEYITDDEMRIKGEVSTTIKHGEEKKITLTVPN